MGVKWNKVAFRPLEHEPQNAVLEVYVKREREIPKEERKIIKEKKLIKRNSRLYGWDTNL